jgi:hypothetical protein
LPANALAIALERFDEPRNVTPTRLIVEDVLRDKSGVEMILAVFLRFFQHGGRTEFEFVHGGGSMTSAAFRASYLEPRPVICAVDSDRRAPASPVGDTARAVLEAKRAAPFPSAEVALLPVREMENAIPLRAIRVVYEQNGDQEVSARCQSLIDFCEADPAKMTRRAEVTAFLDFKTGLADRDIETLNINYSDVLRDLWGFANGGRPCPDLGDRTEYVRHRPFVGISNNLLQVVSETFDTKPYVLKDIARNYKKLPHYADLLKYSKMLTDFGAAPSPIPVRLN